jgi:hypothetical protein
MQEILPRIVETLASSGAILLSVVSLIVAVLTYLRRGRLKLGQFEVEFRGTELQREVELVTGHLHPPPAKLEQPVDRQYALMREYHAQGLA